VLPLVYPVFVHVYPNILIFCIDIDLYKAFRVNMELCHKTLPHLASEAHDTVEVDP
jgi:hypothetical protein